jgi:hypothetical protein
MLTWMEHSKHGRMPCYSVQEVESNKKNGWKEISNPPWSASEQNEPTLQTQSAETASIPVPTTSQETPKEIDQAPKNGERIKRKYTRKVKMDS